MLGLLKLTFHVAGVFFMLFSMALLGGLGLILIEVLR